MKQIEFVCRALSQLLSKENFVENGRLDVMSAMRLMLAVLLSAMVGWTYALGNNLAPQAKVMVSSAVDEKHGGPCLVNGGTPERRVKFYTDLWHVLLGRHKIDDASGDYPDYTQYDHTEGNACIGAKLRVRHLPMLKSGEAKHHYIILMLSGSLCGTSTLCGDLPIMKCSTILQPRWCR